MKLGIAVACVFAAVTSSATSHAVSYWTSGIEGPVSAPPSCSPPSKGSAERLRAVAPQAGVELPGQALVVDLEHTVCFVGEVRDSQLSDLVVVGDARDGQPTWRVHLARVNREGASALELRIDNPFPKPLRVTVATPIANSPNSFSAERLVTAPANGWAITGWRDTDAPFALVDFHFAEEPEVGPPPFVEVEDDGGSHPDAHPDRSSWENPWSYIALGLGYEWLDDPLPELSSELATNGYTGLAASRHALGLTTGLEDYRIRFGLHFVFGWREVTGGAETAEVRQASYGVDVGYDLYRWQAVRAFATIGVMADQTVVASPPARPALFVPETTGCCAGRGELLYRRTPIRLPLLVGVEHMPWANDDTSVAFTWGGSVGYGVLLSEGSWEPMDQAPAVQGGPAVGTSGFFIRTRLTLLTSL